MCGTDDGILCRHSDLTQFYFQGSWSESIKNRFKHVRKYDMKKRKVAGDLMNTPSPTTKKPKRDQPPTQADLWSVIPQIPKGFTEDIYEEHVSALQKEVRLSKPNEAKITELMKSTFEVRRRDIMSKIRPIKEIVEKYPPLATCAGVSIICYNLRNECHVRCTSFTLCFYTATKIYSLCTGES